MQKKHQKSPVFWDDGIGDAYDDTDDEEEYLDCLIDDPFALEEAAPDQVNAFTIYHSLTSRQQEIIRFKYRGIQQTEIAAHYDVSSPAISRQMNGIKKHFIVYCQKKHLLGG